MRSRAFSFILFVPEVVSSVQFGGTFLFFLFLLQSFEETLLKDVWKLFQAGKFDEAKSLCRAAGQVYTNLPII